MTILTAGFDVSGLRETFGYSFHPIAPAQATIEQVREVLSVQSVDVAPDGLIAQAVASVYVDARIEVQWWNDVQDSLESD
ncbi:hypothetical protein [Kineococcus sp. SYSU DK002]|uniref:hypothetical protein n=1 Tax=Kineococcus sp. SYSU DK002 TaxID=3383123 RepID=UPI003D7EB1F9